MSCQSHEELEQFVEQARPKANQGRIADYIPALGKANPTDLSIAIEYPNGRCISAGDVERRFTLQSISKVITLALALMDNGREVVFDHVGMEPTGDPFNSIAKLETNKPAKPLNPMINAGALVVTHLIKGDSVDERLNRILSFIRELANDESIDYSKEIAQSEYDTADLNRSLSYFLKEHHHITEDVDQLIDLYTKQCAIEMNCLNLARIGMIFAEDGKDPHTQTQIMPESIARLCKTFMVTCGMYNASGEFAIKIGIPAKSGVSGGIMGSVPHRFGIGIFGPALDDVGNSIAGLELLELLSSNYKLSMF
ncbi:L-glutaminase [Pelagirhabdus alkalitolerans]|uniref:Glutaminase n=1 Tax=Pelagirhabdus alkalitolerans TaxID=1612202 RepID=A0A1G6H5P5_9BACI|nr:glutaminase A [Pelagirhabdus alkalitolerans]SDB89582.1 L-glutaminase [Pelagirhabdus alkalitolerans]